MSDELTRLEGLLERLRARVPTGGHIAAMGSASMLVNPAGPEAANEISSLISRLRAAEAECGAMREALAEYDAAVSECPVRISRISLPKCPKCGATPNNGCGEEAGASHIFIQVVRDHLKGQS